MEFVDLSQLICHLLIREGRGKEKLFLRNNYIWITHVIP